MKWKKKHQQHQQQQQQDVVTMDSIPAQLEATQEFLSLHWLLQAVDVMVASHAQIHEQLSSASAPFWDDDPGFVSDFMDKTAKLLEACNSLTRIMAAAARSKLHIKYVIHRLSDCLNLKDQKDFHRMKKLVQDCIAQLQVLHQPISHTGSYWLLLEELSYSNPRSISKKMNRIASKVMEANLVSAVVLTALFAGFSPPFASLQEHHHQQHPQLDPAWRRLRESIRAEADQACVKEEAVVVILLEGVLCSLKQIDQSLLLGDADDEKMKLLLHQASKKLDYFESGLGILEEQLKELFKTLVANRKRVLLLSTA